MIYKLKQKVKANRKAKEIKDYVADHYKHFGAYPMDVEIDGVIYDYEEYWEIISGQPRKINWKAVWEMIFSTLLMAFLIALVTADFFNLWG